MGVVEGLKSKMPRVALVHDWLTGLRGGERCLLTLLKIYPQADVFTLIHQPGSTDPLIDQRVCSSSFLQRLPGVHRYYRVLLPLMPKAVNSLDVKGYDLVISLSHAAAKNIAVSPGCRHICYCFTPMRYIWDQHSNYLGSLTPLAWPLIKSLRSWDQKGSDGVSEFVAISKFVAARIRRFYGRRSSVIYPPVDTSWIAPLTTRKAGEAFLWAGALVPYKRPEVVVKAFKELGLPLWVVGVGGRKRVASLKRLAGPRTSFLGHVSSEVLSSLYARCRGLVFPGVEDFGMVPVEVMAAGRPVIAMGAGGALESVRGIKAWSDEHADYSQATGLFLFPNNKEPVEELISGVERFLQFEEQISPTACINQAQNFSPQRFFSSWLSLAERVGFYPGLSSELISSATADKAVGGLPSSHSLG